jgi:hypothetical protein
MSYDAIRVEQEIIEILRNPDSTTEQIRANLDGYANRLRQMPQRIRDEFWQNVDNLNENTRQEVISNILGLFQVNN